MQHLLPENPLFRFPPPRYGKVRDIHDLGDGRLALFATDAISAFDWVLPTGIPDKGKILTKLSKFWFDFFKVPHHVISYDVSDLPPEFAPYHELLSGRTMIVKKAEVIPIECVVRGYLAGSGWKEYRETGRVCGIKLEPGLQQAQKLPHPIFTPATKADSGHDENISFDHMRTIVDSNTAEQLRTDSIDIYQRAAAYALKRGIIIADTKFEWGRLPNGDIILIDELLTPDSSRFWPADQYKVGTSPLSFDKQFVRDWLEATNWDKNSPPPPLPPNIVAKTYEKYREAYERLTGYPLAA